MLSKLADPMEQLEVFANTKTPLLCQGTGLKDRGNMEMTCVMVTAQHFKDQGKILPVHLDGPVKARGDAGVAKMTNVLYSTIKTV